MVPLISSHTALLMKVVLDPAVAKDQTLRQNILTRRQEALDKCSHMNDLLEKRLSQRSGPANTLLQVYSIKIIS